jgi:hypothetical protein
MRKICAPVARRCDIGGYAVCGPALGLTSADRAWCK